MKNCTFVRVISRKPSSSTRYFWCEEKQVYFNVLWPSCGTNNIKNYDLFRKYILFCVFEDQHPTFWDCHSSHLHVQFQVSEVRDFKPISSLQSKYSSHAMHSTAYRLELLFIEGQRNQCEYVYQARNLYACHLCSHSWCSTNYSRKG